MIPTILHFVALFVIVVVISNSKFGMLFFFSCNLFNKTFANVLFFVRAMYFALTTSQTFCFLFPAAIASSLFSGVAFKKYVIKQEIYIGTCLANVSLSPDLKTSISFLSYSIAFSRASILHTKLCPIDGSQMSLWIWCPRIAVWNSTI